MRSSPIFVFAGLFAAAGIAIGAGDPGKPKVRYSAVEPIVKTKCLSCHNDKRHPEKVDLSSYAALMKSGEHKPIVVAGRPEKSSFYLYVDGEKQPRMPFKAAPLTPKEIAKIRAWISGGAAK